MDRDTKVESYLAHLEANPNDLATLTRLEGLFEPQDNWKELVGLLHQRADQLGASEASARFFLEAARIADSRLRDLELSASLMDRAVAVGEGTSISPEVGVFLLAQQEQWEDMIAFFGEAVENLPEPDDKSRLYLRMGSIFETLFEDFDEAENAYRWALQLDPTNVSAMWAQQHLLRRRERWEDLAQLLYQEAELYESSEQVEESDRQLELMLRLGDLYRDQLGMAETAAQYYVSVYEHHPANPRARAALEALGYEVPALDDDGTTNGATAEAVPVEAELEVEPLSETMSEVDEIDELEAIEDIEAVEPAAEDAPSSLDAISDPHTMDLDEAMILEVGGPPPAPETENGAESDADSEVDLELEAVSEADSETFSEAELLLDEEQGGESSVARDEVELDGVDEYVLVEAGEAEAEEVELEEVGESWRDRMSAALEAANGDDAITSVVYAARLEARHRESLDDALRIWRQAIAQDLEGKLWERTHFLYHDADFWQTILDEIDNAALQARIALIDLQDDERARTLAGDDAAMAELFEDLEAGDSNWRKFQRALETRYADRDEDAKAVAVYWRMADIASARGDLDKEMDALRRLDRAIDGDGRVRSRLKDVYKRAEKWPMFVDLLKQDAAEIDADDAVEKIDVLEQMVEVYRDHMNHDMMVVNTYKEILEVDPTHIPAIDALIGLYDKLTRSTDLVNMLQAKAELVTSDADKVRIYSDIAQLFLEKFRNQAEAIKAYESVLEIEAHHPDALSFLKEAYEKRRDWEKLIDVHLREIETFESADEKVAGLKQVAALATDRLRKPEVASDLWLQVRDVSPRDAEALDALEGLYEKNKDFEALAEILETKAEISDDVAEQMKLYQKMGHLYSDRLDDSARAVGAWRNALALQPDDLKSRKALERLYIDHQDWDALEAFYGESSTYQDLVRLLETLAGTVKEDEVKIELLLRAARVWRTELHDTGRAERDLERVVQIDPMNEAAALQLEPIYLEANDAAKLGEVYAIILEHRTEPEERRDYQLKLAALHEEQLGDVAGAFAWYARAFRSMPESDEVIVDLERTAGASENWPGVVESYAAALDEAGDPGVERQLRMRLGRVLAEELRELDAALEQYQGVLDDEPENQEALSALAQIYEWQANWDALMGVYELRIGLTEDPAEQVKIYNGMALIAEEQAGDVDLAIERYLQALELDQKNEPALLQLHRLYSAEARYADLAGVIRSEIQLIQDRASARAQFAASAVDPVALIEGREPEAFVDDAAISEVGFDAESESEADFDADSDVAYLSEASESLEAGSQISEISEAIEAAAEVVEEVEEEEVDEVDEVAVLAEAGGNVDAAASTRGVLRFTDDEVDRLVELHYELGFLAKMHLDRHAEAVEALGTVLAWRPNHTAARDEIEDYLADDEFQLDVARSLEPVYEIQGNWEGLIDVLEVQLAASDDTAETVALLEQIGQTYLAELGRLEDSFDAYGRLLRLRPTHEGARRQLTRLADALSAWQQLVDLYEGILPSIDDTDLQIAYHHAIADLYAEDLEAHEEARLAYEQVLALSPGSQEALDDLESLFTRTDQWEQLQGVLERKLELAGDTETERELKFRTALLWEEALEDRSEAIGIYRAILAEEPSSVRAIDSLNRLYAAEGQWDELAANLERQLELVDGAAVYSLKNRLAEVLYTRSEQGERAVDLYEEVLGEDAHNSEALDAMETMMVAGDAPSGRISRILEPLYIGRDDWRSLIVALEVQAETSAEPADRVALLHRVADLYESRARSLSEAFDAYSRALHYGVDDASTLENLYRLAQQNHGYGELVATFEREAAAQAEPLVRRDMLRRAAAVYRDAIMDLDRATQRLHEVLEIAAEDLETVVELETIYRQTQDWAALVDVMIRKADLVDADEERTTLLHQSGTMLEDVLEQPVAAIDVYNRILAIDDADATAIDRLQVLYRGQEQWDDLLRVYERQVELAADDEARKDLFYAMGAIYRESLGQPHDAIEVFRKILAIDPQELAAWVELDELFEQTEQWAELLGTLDAELQLTHVPEDWFTLKYRMGRLHEAELFDVPKAIEVYQEVLTEDATHQATTEALEGMIERGDHGAQAAEVLEPIYRDAGQWPQLVRVYRLLIDATEDVDRKLELYVEVGTIYEHRQHDPEAAFETYVEALSAAPHRVEILDTLERLAADLEAWEVLIERLDEQLDGLADFGAAREITVRIARFYELELDQAAPAIERYRRVLEIEPDDQVAIEALDRLYEREGQWWELAEILRLRIRGADDAEQQLRLRLRLGQLFQSALEDADEALEVYQAILLEDPENPQAIQALEQMFMGGQAVQRVASILEPFYTSRGQHGKLVEIYYQRLQQLDEPQERYDVWMLIAHTFLNELDEPESALQAYGRALAEVPEERQLIERVSELAGRTGNWQAAAEVLADALESEQANADNEAPIYLGLAEIFDRQLGMIDDAETCYQQVLERDEGESRALEALDRIYEGQARWEELAVVIQKRILGVYDEEPIIELNFRLAELFQQQLGQFDRAVSTYRTILDIQPAHAASLRMLQHIHYERQEWEPLYDVLEQQAEIDDDFDARADIYGQMARLAEEMLDRRHDAIDLWSRVLQMREDDLEALRELRRLYTGDERWSDLVTILEREVELTPMPEEQLPLYERLGTIWSHQLANEGQALEAWQKVLAIDPGYLPALLALHGIFGRQADYGELSQVIYRLLEHPDVEPEHRLELWIEQGTLQGEMLLQPEPAIEAWKSVLALEPGNERALDQLELQFLQESRWEEAAEILEMKLDLLVEEEERIELLLRIADLWENRIMDRGRAAQFYEYILEVDPTNERAGLSLESIYREQGTDDAYQALAALYLDRSDQRAHDTDAFLEARRQSSRIFGEHLQNHEGAFLVLLTALRPETAYDEQLPDELERLARQTGQWAELVATYHEVLQQLGESIDAAQLHRRVGTWQADELGQPDEAVYHLQRALAIEPDNIEVIDSLERLYREIAAWPELAQILRTRVELTMDPDEQAELWRKLGELYEMQMGEVDEAVDAYQRILAVDPGDILGLESLERIYEAYDRWEDLIEILTRKAEATYEPEDIVDIRFRIAMIWEERLDSLERAIGAYNEILAVDQAYAPALEQLERLHMMREEWDALLDVYEQRLQLTHEPDEQVAIYGRMASLHEDQFGDVDRAIETFNNILMVDPAQVEAIANLERLYQGHERWFDLVDVLQRHADVAASEPEQQVEVLNRLARVQRDQIGDPNAAIEAFNRSLVVDGAQTEVLNELASLYEDTANWESAIDAYRRLIDAVDDADYRVDVTHRVGFLYEANLQDDQAAEEAYHRALEMAPGHEATLLALRDLYGRRQDWQGVIRILKQAEESSRDLEQKAKYLCEIGKVYEAEMDDSVSALHYYETALEYDPEIVDAAEPLIDLYVAEQRWERAVPLLEQVVRDDRDWSQEEEHRRWLQYAVVNDKLGRADEALRAYRHAYEVEPTHTDTLKGLGGLLYDREEWEQAFKIFQALQFNHADELEIDEIVDIYFKSGVIKERVGERRKAIQMYQKAMEYVPHHLPSLNALVEAFEAEEQWDQVVDHLRYLLEADTDETVRFAYLTRIGDLYAAKLNQPMPATEAYLDALDLEPKSVVVLRKLLPIYQKAQQWSEAIDILQRLIEQEERPSLRAKWLYAAAIILRDEVQDAMGAVEYFDAALDADISNLKPFEAIDRILTQQKAWKDLERAYRRMLRRVTENDNGQMTPVKILLWQSLGEIYRSRLGHLNSAIQAFEATIGLDPTNEKVRLILAELYERSGEHPDGAIEQHKELIKIDPFRIDSYRALWKAYMQKKQYDRAWCMAGALVLLQNASDQEEKFYRQYLGQNLKLAKGALNQEMLKLLYHERQDMLVSLIMSLLGQGLRPYYARPIKEWGVHKKKDILSPDEQLMFCKIYSYSARTGGLMPAPTLYLRKDQALGMRNANIDPPAFIVGGDMMQGKGDRELAFTVGKQVCWARPEHYLGSVGYPTEVLKLFFMASMHITDTSLGLDRVLGEQGPQVIQEIQRMPGQMLMQLQKLMKTYLAKGENPNLSEWLTNVDHTTSRMGLLLCGDLQQAASCIKNDVNPVGKSSVKEKIRELVLFSISDEYFELREQLGLSIDNR